MRFPEFALAVFAAATTCGAASAADSPYLYVIPAQRESGDEAILGDRLQAVLHVPDTDRFVAHIRSGGTLEILDSGPGRVTIGFGRKPTLRDAPDEGDRADTFVIDYSEPAVAGVVTELREDFDEHPSIADLQRFVYDHVEDQTYLGDFAVASRVAETKTGDCTEFAVLLAALGRASGYPARVVFGVVLFETDAGPQAYGHAWTEIHDGSSWQLADATLIGDLSLRNGPYYLPLLSLDDEGPGFGLDMIRIMHVQPSRISNIANIRP